MSQNNALTGRREYQARKSIEEGLTIGTEISYRCSECPITGMPLLGDLLCTAVQSSNQWKFERSTSNEPTTDCLNALVPEDRSQDISITLRVGYEEGLRLIKNLGLAST